jgi:hypothetical protein
MKPRKGYPSRSPAESDFGWGISRGMVESFFSVLLCSSFPILLFPSIRFSKIFLNASTYCLACVTPPLALIRQLYNYRLPLEWFISFPQRTNRRFHLVSRSQIQN